MLSFLKRFYWYLAKQVAKIPDTRSGKWFVPCRMTHVPFTSDDVRGIRYRNTPWSHWFADTVDCLIASYEEQENRANCLEDALRELVDLKELKDTHGKTLDYQERQPMAWQNARLLLGKQP